MGRTTTCGDHHGSPATIQWLSTMRAKTDAAGHKTEGLKNRKGTSIKTGLEIEGHIKTESDTEIQNKNRMECLVKAEAKNYSLHKQPRRDYKSA